MKRSTANRLAPWLGCLLMLGIFAIPVAVATVLVVLIVKALL